MLSEEVQGHFKLAVCLGAVSNLLPSLYIGLFLYFTCTDQFKKSFCDLLFHSFIKAIFSEHISVSLLTGEITSLLNLVLSL